MSTHVPVIVSAARTPIGTFMGALSELKVTALGALVVKEVLQRAGIEASQVDEVIMGNVLTAGVGQNPARQAALGAGLPVHVPALTVNKVCGSGLKAVMLAAQAIKAGDAEVVVAGGMESMSNAPFLLPDARKGLRLGHGALRDSLVQDGLWDVYNDFHMGTTAELVAEKYKISRQAQDEYALNSHRKACTATQAGAFRAEIIPVTIPQRKGVPVTVFHDEGPRADSNLEKLGKLRPVFDEKGSVTAGNASSINDGAAAVVVMSQQRAEALGVKPLARITGYATGGVEPKWVMMAPMEAAKALRSKQGVDIRQVDLIELNEAFSVQSIAVCRELELDPDRVNVNGGAVALGHPIGASGARILVTLLYALRARGGGKGVATLCLGGGNAVAMAVELL